MTWKMAKIDIYTINTLVQNYEFFIGSDLDVMDDHTNKSSFSKNNLGPF